VGSGNFPRRGSSLRGYSANHFTQPENNCQKQAIAHPVVQYLPSKLHFLSFCTVSEQPLGINPDLCIQNAHSIIEILDRFESFRRSQFMLELTLDLCCGKKPIDQFHQDEQLKYCLHATLVSHADLATIQPARLTLRVIAPKNVNRPPLNQIHPEKVTCSC
jgi:hypothetical protein